MPKTRQTTRATVILNLSEPLFDTRDVATLFHLPVSTIRRWARTGRLPTIKVGRFHKFSRRDILQLLGTTTEDPLC